MKGLIRSDPARLRTKYACLLAATVECLVDRMEWQHDADDGGDKK